MKFLRLTKIVETDCHVIRWPNFGHFVGTVGCQWRVETLHLRVKTIWILMAHYDPLLVFQIESLFTPCPTLCHSLRYFCLAPPTPPWPWPSKDSSRSVIHSTNKSETWRPGTLSSPSSYSSLSMACHGRHLSLRVIQICYARSYSVPQVFWIWSEDGGRAALFFIGPKSIVGCDRRHK